MIARSGCRRVRSTYRTTELDERPLKDLISTGLACGPTYANALLKALGEVVERDAYTITWQNRLPRPHIDLESVDDPLICRFLRVLQRLAIQPRAVYLTLDIPIPVFLIVMTRSDGPPWTIVASGADLSPRHALLLALEEACLGSHRNRPVCRGRPGLSACRRLQ